MEKTMNVDIIIPTYQPDASLQILLNKLNKQTVIPKKIIIVNTGPDFIDGRLPENVEVFFIEKSEFDHGATRNLAIARSKSDYFICMTQDAVPQNTRLIEELLNPFADATVAMTYARQVPKSNANLIERYTRSHNYPDADRKKTQADAEELGIKLYFASNVCACYKREVFDRVGKFREDLILNEDMIFAHTIIQSGYAIFYASKAVVLHSHNYSGWQQLSRNFDIGQSQAEFSEVFSRYKSEKEGKALVLGNLLYVLRRWRIDQAIRLIYISGCKYIGYFLGKRYKKMPRAWCKFLSMNKGYWET